MHSQITDPTKQVGKPGELNCNATGNIGCTVLETKPNSFGQSFSQNGGGVFATQFDTSGCVACSSFTNILLTLH